MAGTANIANTSVVPSATRGAPYYDDFDESKNFKRILFRPGYPVQSRELTQMQTMAQVQTERLGRSIYVNGSLVQGGQISLEKAVTLNLQVQYAGSDVNVAQFVDQSIAYGSSNTLVQARVIGTSANSSTEPPSLTVKYYTGNEFNAGDTIMVPNTSAFANIAAASPNTVASVASINDGIFFINGFFVRAPGQTVVVSKYTPNANARIGLEISESIVNEGEDTSLLDPAQESSNYQAPGAERFKIDLVLATRSLTSTDDSAFIELMRIENGIVKKKVIYPTYSDLEDTLARRTFDESGSYTVRAFKLNLTDDSSEPNNVIAVLDPGKAYVYGYEFETIAQSLITVPRARTTRSVGAYGLPLSYGYYLTVTNGKGFFNHTTPDLVDLHCLDHQYVSNTTGGTPSGVHYRSSKIGTARVRMMLYDGATSNAANSLQRNYRVYLYDTQITNLSSNIHAVNNPSSFILYDPATTGNVFSANTRAYVGATLRLTSGLGANQVGIISDYTINAAGFKTVNTNTAFVITPNNQTRFAIEFDTRDIKSIINPISGNTGANSTWMKYTVSDTSKSAGVTRIQESTDPSLVFPLPQDFIKAGSLLTPVAPNYRYRKVFTGVQFTSGTISSPVGGIQVDGINEQFLVSGGASSGDSSTVLSNFIVYVTNPQSTTRSNNDVVQLGSISVSGGGGATHFVQMTTDGSVASDTFVATVVATVEIIAGGETGPKTKVKYTGNTRFFNPASSASNGSFQTTFPVFDNLPAVTSNATVYLQAGQVVIQNPAKIPGQKQSLFISDALRVSKIYDLAGASVPAFAADITAYTDVSNKFIFNNGQTDTHYGHSSITLKSGQSAPAGNLIVCVDWYDHAAGYTSTGLGYFSIDSYPNSTTANGYGEIPSYRGSDGIDYSLRDCIDFRPKIDNAQNTVLSYTYTGQRFPVPGETFDIGQYEYYLSRRDKLVLTKDRQFKLIQGIPALNPQEPGNITDSMILYKLYIPAYTLSTSNIDVTYVENKRYTMRDIGALETRISNLEYYTTLSLLEKDATDITITDEFGLARTKYGVIVDSFTGHSIGDVTSEDYDCSMDVVEGGMTARNFATASKLYYASNTNVKLIGQVAMLDYTEEDFVTQPFATKTVNVQPYMFAIYAGSLQMWPDADIWVDTITAPAVIINPAGQNDQLITVPPRANGTVPIANTTPVPDPQGGRRRWWEIGQFGRRSREADTIRVRRNVITRI